MAICGDATTLIRPRRWSGASAASRSARSVTWAAYLASLPTRRGDEGLFERLSKLPTYSVLLHSLQHYFKNGSTYFPFKNLLPAKEPSLFLGSALF